MLFGERGGFLFLAFVSRLAGILIKRTERHQAEVGGLFGVGKTKLQNKPGLGPQTGSPLRVRSERKIRLRGVRTGSHTIRQ